MSETKSRLPNKINISGVNVPCAITLRNWIAHEIVTAIIPMEKISIKKTITR